MKGQLHIAVDLGAGSGRVFLGGFGEEDFLLEEVRRFRYPPRILNGHLRWDAGLILAEIEAGLTGAARRAGELGSSISSIGVDSWGVDYGLIDEDGALIEDPVCYRDERATKVMDRVLDLIPREELHRLTGIQILSLNTIFQLYAHSLEGIPDNATHLLLIPDLVNFHLTGIAQTEYTNATTTQLINPETRSWAWSIIERLGLPGRLFTGIVEAGTEVGELRPELAARLGLEGVRVIAPATHDTGSAFAGAPLRDGWACISSGTWSLVGVELGGPVINDQTARSNFTNEGGGYGNTRFLRNVMGLWILESCRKEWLDHGIAVDYDVLLGEVAARREPAGLIYPDDERFLNPESMTAAINRQLVETGQAAQDSPATMAKTVLDSLALRYASVIRSIERITGRNIEGVQIVGGGSRNDYLNRATANSTGKPVLAGPVESTVIGNILVQAIASRRFATLAEARAYISDRISPRRFDPELDSYWLDASGRYSRFEARFDH
ncbi:MAG: rhamnulokinase [Acidobacteriota bacterium]|nr:MAG: rhamnulokinase [Acidobacteriota bacterium]